MAQFRRPFQGALDGLVLRQPEAIELPASRPPVTVESVGAGVPSGPITFGSQS